MNPTEHKLQKKLEKVSEIEGKGTELVSLYIPPDKSLRSVRERISEEISEASNIKSDRTRKNVESALNKIQGILKKYENTPSSGLAVFCGVVDGELRSFVFDDLPFEVRESMYDCDSKFKAGPLLQSIESGPQFGLIVIERGRGAVALYSSSQITEIREVESHVQGKSKAGGQSAARFRRVREKQKQNFFQKIGNIAGETFIQENSLRVDGVLVGGTQITLQQFIESGSLDYRIQDSILARERVDFAGKQGLESLVEKCKSRLSDDVAAREHMERFYTGLSDETSETVTYSEDNVRRALEFGAVETCLLSEEIDSQTVEEIEQLVHKQGGDIVIVPTTFDRGKNLWESFGGFGAILRFEIS